MKKSFNGYEYEYVDPTGNITVLVTSRVDEGDRTRVADIIMEEERTCEQVGFLGPSDTCDIKLDMAAGEFCGNATMSAAVVFFDKKDPKPDSSASVTVESSGCSSPITVNITRMKDEGEGGLYSGRIHMPAPARIMERVFTYLGRRYVLPVVEFDGIMHVIVSSDELGMSDAEAEDAIVMWCTRLNANSMGIMILSDMNEESVTIRPVVYVPGAGTCFWERSCASGTTAVGAYYISKGLMKDRTLLAKEPGGTLTVTKDQDNGIILCATVRL